MRVKTTKRLLNLASLVVLSAAGAVVYWGMLPDSKLDVDVPGVREATANTKLTAPTPTAASIKPSDRKVITAGLNGTVLMTNWGRALRRPLFDPPPPAPIVVAKAPPQPLRVILLATVMESENSTAMLKLANGQVVFRKVGESLGTEEPSAKISKIETGSILVYRGSEELRLSVAGMDVK
jgi:hypothetical protein